MYTFPSDFDVFWDDVATVSLSLVHECGDNGGAYTHVGVQDRVSGVCHGEYQSFYQFYRELAWVNSLFDMVVFDVWESPYVAGIFAFWVS